MRHASWSSSTKYIMHVVEEQCKVRRRELYMVSRGGAVHGVSWSNCTWCVMHLGQYKMRRGGAIQGGVLRH